jgi:hypothetical protein
MGVAEDRQQGIFFVSLMGRPMHICKALLYVIRSTRVYNSAHRGTTAAAHFKRLTR